MDKLQIVNARVIVPGDILHGVTVLVREGRIAGLSSTAADPAEWKTLDAEGAYLSPGFIDLHNHGRMVADAMEGTREALQKIAAHQLSHGVTGFLITTQSAPLEPTLAVIKAAADYIDAPASDGAQPLGIYLEGPFFSGVRSGAQLADASGVDLDALTAMAETGRGHVRVVSLAPELPNAIEAIGMLAGRGVLPAAGHTDSTFEQAAQAICAGLGLATHTFNGMRPLDHREPSVVGACLTDDRVTCEIIADGIHLHPATVKLICRIKGPRNTVLVSDSVAATGIPDGDYDYAGRAVSVKEGVVRLADGTLAGSSLSLDEAVRNVRRFTGCPLHEAVEMASLTPARVLGVSAQKGSIAAGKDADMVLFDEEVSVKTTILGGVPG